MRDGPPDPNPNAPPQLQPSREVADAIAADLEIRYAEVGRAYKPLLKLVERPPENEAEEKLVMVAVYIVVGELAQRAHRAGDPLPPPSSIVLPN